MTDPRTSMISKRLRGVRSVIAVSSGKGGVGKSLIASVLALVLARKGFKVGLFDLDFTGPSTHIILGTGKLKPREENGIIPPVIEGLKYMSIVHYVHDHASPLRGSDISNALTELLAVTVWGELDYLIMDTSPGICDSTLDLLTLVKDIKFLIVTTPSNLAFETVRKLISLLLELNASVIGVIENMRMRHSDHTRQQTERLGARYWGAIAFDPRLEESIGNTDKLLMTEFTKSLEEIAERILRLRLVE